MRRHHVVGIPPSELGGIATPRQDAKGGNAGSRSGTPEEDPARYPGHGESPSAPATTPAAAGTSMAPTDFPGQLFAGCHFLDNQWLWPEKCGMVRSVRANDTA